MTTTAYKAPPNLASSPTKQKRTSTLGGLFKSSSSSEIVPPPPPQQQPRTLVKGSTRPSASSSSSRQQQQSAPNSRLPPPSHPPPALPLSASASQGRYYSGVYVPDDGLRPSERFARPSTPLSFLAPPASISPAVSSNSSNSSGYVTARESHMHRPTAQPQQPQQQPQRERKEPIQLTPRKKTSLSSSTPASQSAGVRQALEQLPKETFFGIGAIPASPPSSQQQQPRIATSLSSSPEKLPSSPSKKRPESATPLTYGATGRRGSADTRATGGSSSEFGAHLAPAGAQGVRSTKSLIRAPDRPERRASNQPPAILASAARGSFRSSSTLGHGQEREQEMPFASPPFYASAGPPSSVGHGSALDLNTAPSPDPAEEDSNREWKQRHLVGYTSPPTSPTKSASAQGSPSKATTVDRPERRTSLQQFGAMQQPQQSVGKSGLAESTSYNSLGVSQSSQSTLNVSQSSSSSGYSPFAAFFGGAASKQTSPNPSSTATFVSNTSFSASQPSSRSTTPAPSSFENAPPPPQPAKYVFAGKPLWEDEDEPVQQARRPLPQPPTGRQREDTQSSVASSRRGGLASGGDSSDGTGNTGTWNTSASVRSSITGRTSASEDNGGGGKKVVVLKSRYGSQASRPSTPSYQAPVQKTGNAFDDFENSFAAPRVIPVRSRTSTNDYSPDIDSPDTNNRASFWTAPSESPYLNEGSPQLPVQSEKYSAAQRARQVLSSSNSMYRSQRSNTAVVMSPRPEVIEAVVNDDHYAAVDGEIEAEGFPRSGSGAVDGEDGDAAAERPSRPREGAPRHLLSKKEEVVRASFEFVLTAFPRTILCGILATLEYSDFASLRMTSKKLKESFDRGGREFVLQRFLGPVGYRTIIPSQYRVKPKAATLGASATSTTSRATRLMASVARKPAAATPDPADELIKLDMRDLDAFMMGLKVSVKNYAKLAKRHAVEELPVERIRLLRAGTRSWNRVVLRIRAQHENAQLQPTPPAALAAYAFPKQRDTMQLFKPGRAPTLRCWVPTAEPWMTDDEVVECEREMWRSGIWPQMQRGHIVWNVALGDYKNNVGRLICDGRYLRDFQYKYDSVGHLPDWLDMLAFPPSYYHNMITSTTTNPVFYMCLNAFADEIRETLALRQDAVHVTGPQFNGTVKRFMYRTSFAVKAGAIIGSNGGVGGFGPGGIDVVHEGWEGTIVIEVEPTTEHATTLLAMCSMAKPTPWRILRERSSPGKIVIRPVTSQERVN